MSSPMSLSTFSSAPVLADHWHGPGAWWPVFPLMWLLVILAVFTVVFLVRRRDFSLGAARAGEARLAERFAAGEIDEQEYRERLAVIKGQGR